MRWWIKHSDVLFKRVLCVLFFKRVLFQKSTLCTLLKSWTTPIIIRWIKINFSWDLILPGTASGFNRNRKPRSVRDNSISARSSFSRTLFLLEFVYHFKRPCVCNMLPYCFLWGLLVVPPSNRYRGNARVTIGSRAKHLMREAKLPRFRFSSRIFPYIYLKSDHVAFSVRYGIRFGVSQ
jgi:hypothetical protein